MKRKQPLYTRRWFQLLGAVLISVLLPLAIRTYGETKILNTPGLFTSVYAASLAILIGDSAWRRFVGYASAEASAYIFWAFVPAFLVVMAMFLMLRMDYNRFIFFFSLVICLVWYFALYFWTKRKIKTRFGIIAGGNVDTLIPTSNSEFIPITVPEIGRTRYDGIIADLRHEHDPQWEHYIAEMTLHGVPVYHYKQMQEFFTGKVSIEYLSENSFGSLLPDINYLNFKRFLDFMIVIIFLPFLLLIMAGTAIIVLVSDGHPVIFRQKRMGFRGVPFITYKFRTMHEHSVSDEMASTLAVTKDNDNRIIPMGNFLRKYRLDELPQCINVLKGQMSWIGPRPEVVSLSRIYEKEIPYYRYRHAVRPGITGWAQVNQGHVTDITKVDDKLKYDFYYIKHVSVWLDMLIALKTVRTVLTGFGAK